MKALRSFETSQNIYPVTQRQMTEDLTLHQHFCETLNYNTKCLKRNVTNIKPQNISLNSALFRPLLLEFNILSVRVAGFSLQHGHYTNTAAPNLQHTTNREQNDRCGNSTAQSQAPDDGYINVRNMLST